MKNIPEHVLLIDDDRPTNFLNQRILSMGNPKSQIMAVSNGYEALDYLSKITIGETSKPGLIFLDINMPAMNGWEFLEMYAKLDSTITHGTKIFMLSTTSNESDIEKGLTHELVQDFVKKPLSKAVVLDLFTKHFNVE